MEILPGIFIGGGLSIVIASGLAFIVYGLFGNRSSRAPETDFRQPERKQRIEEQPATNGSGSNELFYAIVGGLIIEILTGRL